MLLSYLIRILQESYGRYQALPRDVKIFFIPHGASRLCEVFICI